MRLEVKFTEISKTFTSSLTGQFRTFISNFKGIQPITTYVGGEEYSGEYVMTPKVREQIMQTKDKVMTDDVTIKSIPFFDVSNNSGGTTVYIGDEV